MFTWRGEGREGCRRTRVRSGAEGGQESVHSREAKVGSSRKSIARREQGAAWILRARSLTTCGATADPRAASGRRLTMPGAASRTPHLSSPAGSESPPESPAPHASSCVPPSCRPEAAGAAGSCSRAMRTARFYDDGAALLPPVSVTCSPFWPGSRQGPTFSSSESSQRTNVGINVSVDAGSSRV